MDTIQLNISKQQFVGLIQSMPENANRFLSADSIAC